MEQSETILIVEDDRVSALSIRRQLENIGYQVVGVVDTGEKALDVVVEAHPSLILMDIVLDGGLDGIETTRLLREKHDVPVVYLTAHTEPEILRRAVQTTPYGFIVKPPQTSWLESTIKMALHNHRTEVARRQSEEKYRRLFDEMLNGFAICEIVCNDQGEAVDFIFLEVNPAFEKSVGISRSDLLKYSAKKNIPDVESIWVDIFGKVALEQESVRFVGFLGTLNRYFDVAAYNVSEKRFAVILNDISDQKRAQAKLQHSIYHDALTNLPNRTHCIERIRGTDERAQREKKRFAILFLDIDRFKIINDSLGHTVGDKLLKEVGLQFLHQIGPMDTVARVGGDEFVLVLSSVSTTEEALERAHMIKRDFDLPLKVLGHQIFTNVSIGIVLGPLEQGSPEDLLRFANMAMNQAKEHGEPHIKVFDWSMHERAAKQLDMETGLRMALDNNEFELFYQPIIALSQKRLAGFEALLRWKRKGNGIISPVEFVPILENTGMIIPVGYWVIRDACETICKWKQRLPQNDPLSVNVNLSAKQFADPELVYKLSRIMNETHIMPSWLKIELTESVVMENPNIAVRTLRALKELGVGICVDDFGTGYSSLNYLQKLPLDTLKVDRSFVSSMDVHANYVIVKTVISLAHSLGLDVTAEGIETSDQYNTLVDLNCQNGQGYLFSRPVEKSVAERLLFEQDTIPYPE